MAVIEFNNGAIKVDADKLNVSMGHGIHGAYSVNGNGRYVLCVIDQEECVPWLSKNAQAKNKDTKLVASTSGAVTLPSGNKLMTNVIQGKQGAVGPEKAKEFGK